MLHKLTFMAEDVTTLQLNDGTVEKMKVCEENGE